jgi:hypothetical protein
MTQKKLIAQYMKDFGSITPWEAFQDLGVTKLATRISEMIADGEKIQKKLETGKNRYGKPVHWMRYNLEAENGNQTDR